MYVVRPRLKIGVFVRSMIAAAAFTAALTLAGRALIGKAASAAPLPVTIVLRDNGFGFSNIGFRADHVRLTVVNKGTRPHALEISGGKGAVAKSKRLKPGQTAKLSLSLRPGNYRLFSPVDHDRADGLSVPLKVMTPSWSNGGAEMNRVFYDYGNSG
ncbi:MAG: cupredoxin domain-containing protein [Pseudolabrys sp.]|jgi:uncharacterized cupredoxin-like copper-binding protein